MSHTLLCFIPDPSPFRPPPLSPLPLPPSALRLYPYSMPLSRDELASRYFDQLPYKPYPIQEEALLAWFSAPQGVLVCTPTGTGKTLIAEAALFEALHTGTHRLLHHAADRPDGAEVPRDAVGRGPLGFPSRRRRPGDRQSPREPRRPRPGRGGRNPPQPPAAPRGLRLQPGQRRGDGRVPQLHRSRARRRLGTLAGPAAAASPHPPALGHRGQRHGIHPLAPPQPPAQARTGQGPGAQGAAEFPLGGRHAAERAPRRDGRRRRRGAADAGLGLLLQPRGVLVAWPSRSRARRSSARASKPGSSRSCSVTTGRQGAGPKLRQLLLRGVGVHHAGLLPKYRRIVEELFQHKLLSIAMCTETLSAGINLPARSVVLPSIIKGPPEKKKLLEPSAAHQIFGRAGRPQFDKQGYVYVLAHEDDVRIARWREHFDQIPADTKDPGPAEGEEEPGAEAAQAPRLGTVLERGPVPEAGGRPGRQALQPRAAALAAAGLHARRLARNRPDPPPGGQAADGLAATGAWPAGAGPHVVDASSGGLRAAGARAAGEGRAAASAAGGAEEGGPGDRVANDRRSRAGPAAGPSLPAGGRPSDARAGQVDRAAERQSALRGLSRRAIGHRRSRRADPGPGKRAGAAALGGAFRPRAEAGPIAPRPAGHHAAGRPTLAARPGHRGRTGHAAQGGNGPPPAHLRRGSRLGAGVGRQAAAALRLPGGWRRPAADGSRSGRPASSWSSAAISTST